MELDPRRLVQIGRRWWWLLLIAPVIAGISAYIISNRQTPMYSASAIIRIGAPANSELNQQLFYVTTDLGETYRQLITYKPVLERVATKLQLPYQPDVTASAIQGSQLIQIDVTNANPETAALIANTVASEFIAYQAENTQAQVAANLKDVNSQLSEAQTQLASVETELKALDTPANASNQETQTRINQLRVQQTQLQSRIDSLQSQSNTIASSVISGQVQISVADPAQTPTSPYSPRPLFDAALGGFVGLFLAIGAIALLEYFDNTVKPDTNIQALAGSPLFSSVPTIARLRPGGNQVYTLADPNSAASEAIRLLRTNLEFAAAVAPLKTIAVTSTSPGEGKSTISANLGVVMAKAGFKTVIVDCDMHRPTQHNIFNVDNERGLSLLIAHPSDGWEAHAHRVALPGLALIPSGPLPPNPADLLVSGNFDAVLKEITDNADVVILDTPPVLSVSDALITSRRSDGVLLLARAGLTKRDALQSAATLLRQGDIRLMGLVLNQRPPDGTGSYYYYSNSPARQAINQAGRADTPSIEVS